MRYCDLPLDMQVLLMQFLEDRVDFDVAIDELADMPLPLVPVTVSEQVESARRVPFDYRGEVQVMAFHDAFVACCDVPPIVVDNGHWIDGRHRILAADRANVAIISGIDWQAFTCAVSSRLHAEYQ
jgi:hypothetical protein